MERHKPTRSPQEVLVLCRERDVRAVDLRFTDLLGRQHQLTIPVSQLSEASFDEGYGFEGFANSPNHSTALSSEMATLAFDAEVLLIPQAETAWIDPFASLPTVVLACSMQDPITREEYAFDPRHVALRAEDYLLNTGVADIALFAPEPEFYIFGDNPLVRRESLILQPSLDSPELIGDQHGQLRSEMMQTLIECGVDVHAHHRTATLTGQAAISVRPERLVAVADALMTYKYIVKNVARKHAKSVTFMPKPIWKSRGSGMHVRLSLARSAESLFGGNGYAGLSDVGLYAIGGLLAHAPALLALTNPSTNSYKRIALGCDEPTLPTYSQRLTSAACRVPMMSVSPKARQIEFRCPDGTCNPYLAMAALLMAMIDGIQNKIHPGEPLDELPAPGLSSLTHLPQSLEQALEALEQDGDFLLRGDVFSEDILRRWIQHKRLQELQPLQAQPHPYECALYYDV